ncbi:MAG: PaaI family thioesterase [Dietzia sp.]
MTSLASILDDYAQQGFGGTLGLRITDHDLAEGRLDGVWDPTAVALDHDGHPYNGAISTVVESMASLAANAEVRPDGRVVGASNSTQFLHPPEHTPIAVRATRIGTTATQLLWQVTVGTQEDPPAAVGIVRLHRLPLT